MNRNRGKNAYELYQTDNQCNNYGSGYLLYPCIADAIMQKTFKESIHSILSILPPQFSVVRHDLSSDHLLHR